MTSSDDEFGAVDDEAFLQAASQSDVLQSDEQPTPDADRPLKRRKLSCAASTNNRRDAGRKATSSNSYSDDSISDVDPPLPPNRRKFSSDETSSEQREKKQTKPKRRICVVTDANIPPDEFVTQLTQPPSSPSEIRGPRWKKMAPPLPPVERKSQDYEPTHRLPTINNSHAIPQSNHAPAPSSDSFQVDSRSRKRHPNFSAESLFVSQDSVTERAQRTKTQGFPPVDSFSIDLDDLPSDAFDSSPASSPKASRNEAFLISSQPALFNSRPTQSNGPPKTFRQTTLFGDRVQVLDESTQNKERHNWPLASKKELPTHHKLNDDALRTWVYPMNLGAVRDYQFNIVSRGLFHNLLVALPTGLGKTFIAATIMLNWFRWTKDAQIVFVAPTKPLVSQQVEACFKTVGMPRSQTTMLTGTTTPGVRAEEWQSKRVFFMTPQTLINDLKTGICDPKKIVLLVVDEAHRATGAYAYVEVVKFLRRFNTSFRVLALTATPGSTVESVQEVLNGLDIARTEIRTEESLDIRSYVHSKNVDTQTFDYSEEMELIMNLCSRAIQPVLTQLNSRNAYWGKDPMMLTPYGLTQARAQWLASDAARNTSWAVKGPTMAMFSSLASVAHTIELLKYHGMGPFFHNMVALRNDPDDKYKKQIVNNEHFKKMMNTLSAWMGNPDFVGHPKLEYVRSIILNHFMDAGEGRGTADGRPPSETRIMVFVHYRDSAEEVVRVLKKHEPMIRPHIFNGQAASKGSEGMDQKTQLATIEAFKKGTYNTLVATSIGEEGLDIGEVDLILCYDSSSSPIRMLQRMGRTGRKRAGNVFLLLMRGKEEDSYTKAKDNYQKIQQIIASGAQFTYHDDRSPRILPKEVQPAVDKRVIEIPVENSQSELPEPKKRARPPKRPPKKFQMPDNVNTGFMKASRINRRRDESPNDVDEDFDDTPQPQRSRIPEPSPEALEIPPLQEALLTPAEERELMRKYANLHDAPSQVIEPPRFDGFPELLRTLGPTKHVKHGRFTKSWARTFKTMHEMPADCAERFQSNLQLEDLWNDPNEGFEELQPPPLSANARFNMRAARTTPKPKKTAPRAPNDPVLVPSPPDDPDRGSSTTLSPASAVGRVELPFYVSQKSQGDEKLEEELPDLDTLFNNTKDGRSGKETSTKFVRPRVRAKRFVIDNEDDDSDE